MNLLDQYKIVPLLSPADLGGSADSNAIDMQNVHHATIMWSFGAITPNSSVYARLIVEKADDAAFSVNQSNIEIAGSLSDDVMGDEDSDLFGTSISCDANQTYITMTGAFVNKAFLYEIPATILAGSRYIRVRIGDQSTATFASATAVLKMRARVITTVLVE